MPESIVIVDYDPEWPAQFAAEKKRINETLGNQSIRIEHIGSTAVTDLPAKPIIDILVGVPDIRQAAECIQALRIIGYEHDPYPQFPERFFMRDGPMGSGPHHVHITEIGTEFWNEKLKFRDWLRRSPVAAAEYASLKKSLVTKLGGDRKRYERYTDAKSVFIARALAEVQRIDADKE